MTNSSETRAQAFDIRLVIAFLIGAYGIVLTVMGIGFTTDEDIAKAADININLWTGIGMLIFAGLFTLWARLRPVTVPAEESERPEQQRKND